MEHFALASGYDMPVLGLGTWPMRGDVCKKAVKEALALGYTHLDTAWRYENHTEIGEALKEINADRSSLFITSKVSQTHLYYDGVVEQCGETLRDLQIDYLDLFLIHWPNQDVPLPETLRALNDLHNEGKIRSIGVSNFSVALLEEAQSVTQAPICVNQIKYYPGEEKPDVLQWCQKNNVVVTAYSPIGKGRILQAPALCDIAKRHNKTPAQVTLRWLVQQDMIVIPKASSRPHLQENMDIFDWSLSKEEMSEVGRLQVS